MAHPFLKRFPAFVPPLRRSRLVLTLCLGSILLCGCSVLSELSYYTQSIRGHFALLESARPVREILAEPHTTESLRRRLTLTQKIRDFSITVLNLPDNASYRRYVDIRPRTAPVWNVVAAPKLSLELKAWCFPVAGCVQYRGYYEQEAALAYARSLQEREPELEINVYRVPAYSTLGYSNWLGGDPLLSSFIGLPEGELARLIFHEMAHQVAYAPGDTAFNEGFASAVEQLGLEKWMQLAASPNAKEEYLVFDQRRRSFLAMTRATRVQLQALYQDKTLSAREKLAQKSTILQALRERYQATKLQDWQGFSGYDHWFNNMNNASFAALALYEDTTADFIALYHAQKGDWQAFYSEVKRLTKLNSKDRSKELSNLRP